MTVAPIAADLTMAQLKVAGRLYVFGAPHVCGGSIYYAKSGRCVRCSRAHHRLPPKRPRGTGATLAEARAADLITYHGSAHRCGGTVRYTKNHKCVGCERARPKT